MHTIIILLMVMFAGAANALSLQPTFLDELAQHDHHIAEFKIANASQRYIEYQIYAENVETSEIVFTSLEPVAGRSNKVVHVTLTDLPINKLEVYRVCAQEKTEDPVALRVCARLRVYWPLPILGPQ